MAKINSTHVFQTDSDLVKIKLNDPNYLIEYSDSNEKQKYCIIYFSSNNIYYPNTEEVFKEKIIAKNYFEWYGTRIEKGQKHIFIRDIQKQWYLNGINSELNSIEKIFEFLKIETKGYKVITLGSSSGGYAAVLFGSFLNAEKILSFNGQFQILDLLKNSCEEVDPIVFREQYNPTVNKYFSIKYFIKSPNRVYYFFSIKSDWDIANKNHIEDVQGLNILSFKTSNHGIPFLRSALSTIINSPYKDLLAINNKIHNPILFSIIYGGFIPTLNDLKKKLKEKWKM